MKARLKKKLAKKKDTCSKRGPAHQLLSPSEAAALLARECWRIKRLLPDLGENRKVLVLTSSVEKMMAALAEMGVEIDDPERTEFRDGMTLKVALFEETSSLPIGRKIVTETLEPAIYINNRLQQQAKVIVSVGTGRE